MRQRPVSVFSIGQAPSFGSGSSFRPVARNPLAATRASPLVRYGGRPVGLNWQHSVRAMQARSSGRPASSAYTARTSDRAAGKETVFTTEPMTGSNHREHRFGV